MFVESQKDIMETRTRIELKIHEIQNINEQTRELCNNLVAIYHKDKNLKPFLSEKDMYIE